MSAPYTDPTIDQYLRDRLMPVEGAIPHLPGIEMYGNSIPAGAVGGDLFEYINFQQRYDIDARIQRAQRLAKEFLEPLPSGVPMRNAVDDHVQWLRRTAGFTPEMETEYRFARSSEQVRVAEDLRDLYLTAGFLVVDAQGHVQSIAIRYCHSDGTFSDAPAYIGETTFMASFWRVLGMRNLVVELTLPPPLPAAGRHRRELSQEAENAIRAVLALGSVGSESETRADRPA